VPLGSIVRDRCGKNPGGRMLQCEDSPSSVAVALREQMGNDY